MRVTDRDINPRLFTEKIPEIHRTIKLEPTLFSLEGLLVMKAWVMMAETVRRNINCNTAGAMAVQLGVLTVTEIINMMIIIPAKILLDNRKPVATVSFSSVEINQFHRNFLVSTLQIVVLTEKSSDTFGQVVTAGSGELQVCRYLDCSSGTILHDLFQV